MESIAQLIFEHDVILTMLSVMEEIADRLEKGMEISTQDIDQSIDFVKEFADRCHHGKEENILFPAMEEAGIPRSGGPIGVMLNEHDLGRNFISGLSESFFRYVNGDKEALPGIVSNIRGYVDLLSHHIAKENQILFQIADAMLPDESKNKLNHQFKEFQRTSIGEERYQNYQKLSEDLADKYLYSKV